MILLPVVLAAAVQRCETGSTYGMRMCWSRRDDAARDRLHTTYQNIVTDMRKLGIDPRRLAGVQTAWTAARDKTCTFEYELDAPGTIAPRRGCAPARRPPASSVESIVSIGAV